MEDIRESLKRWFVLHQQRFNESRYPEMGMGPEFNELTIKVASFCEKQGIDSMPLLELISDSFVYCDRDDYGSPGWVGSSEWRRSFATAKRAELRIGLPPLIAHPDLLIGEILNQLKCSRPTLRKFIKAAGLTSPTTGQNNFRYTHEQVISIYKKAVKNQKEPFASNARKQLSFT